MRKAAKSAQELATQISHHALMHLKQTSQIQPVYEASAFHETQIKLIYNKNQVANKGHVENNLQ